mgnify:CR=1 FL=1
MSQILVTGGAGFIGSHLVPALIAAGHSVRVLDTLSPQIHEALPVRLNWLTQTPSVEFIRGSVTDRATLTAALDGVQGVVHLASETGTGQSMYQIEHYYRTNVTGTAILKAATGPIFSRTSFTTSPCISSTGRLTPLLKIMKPAGN